ncbi:Retrovirus-related Pol polyprotein from transposon TNT 1-94 [Trichinella pseudospiralis]|uniref:Retrovirus-related Pol polyprotein from transposon TNT 1-94 n=1 Tax=Trichinella pseudospiralis TaxID=6337 RepID=A0A0V1J1Q9_TRIPS|nr:Retrovirus-related Pol polyprotein from transposon TNT 1-94 [Trichinella pseudospiralis]
MKYKEEMGRLRSEKNDLWTKDTHRCKVLFTKTRSPLRWLFLAALSCVIGSEQASRAWYGMLDDTLQSFVLNRLKKEPCMYFYGKLPRLWCICGRSADTLKQNASSENEENEESESWKTLKMAHCRLSSSSTWRRNGQFRTAEAVGCLVYLSRSCLSDICHSVGIVSHFSNNPGKTHWTAVKRIFRYLKEDRRSISGCLVCHSGAAIAWSPKNQRTWSPTIDRSVFVSNHIDIKHHFVKEEVQEGKLEIRQIPSGDNAGDMIAKALMPSRLVACVKLIRIAA